ncbi:hypothetical protein ACFQRI_25220, partial [Saccharopolyspora griseoalba]
TGSPCAPRWEPGCSTSGTPTTGRNPRPAAPAASAAPAAFNGEPPRRPEPPRTNGADPEATRISQALTTADRPARRNPRPPAGAPAPARPPAAPAADPEATTQHAPVRPQQAKPKQAEETAASTRVVDPEEAGPVPESPAEATAVVAPADGYAELDAFDDDDDDFGGEEVEREERNNDVQQIDATLARFSAVHDEIAAEEAKRRRFFGKRKEPELGTDMPFDFHDSEGRDGKSRMEWKKNQRKRRTNLIVLSVAIVASLTVFLSLGLMWG